MEDPDGTATDDGSDAMFNYEYDDKLELIPFSHFFYKLQWSAECT